MKNRIVISNPGKKPIKVMHRKEDDSLYDDDVIIGAHGCWQFEIEGNETLVVMDFKE